MDAEKVVTEALKLMKKQVENDNGKDFKFEEGDEIVGVFNDAIIIQTIEDGQLKINVILGEPHRIDFNLNL